MNEHTAQQISPRAASIARALIADLGRAERALDKANTPHTWEAYQNALHALVSFVEDHEELQSSQYDPR